MLRIFRLDHCQVHLYKILLFITGEIFWNVRKHFCLIKVCVSAFSFTIVQGIYVQETLIILYTQMIKIFIHKI
jgi:hypothetical protein